MRRIWTSVDAFDDTKAPIFKVAHSEDIRSCFVSAIGQVAHWWITKSIRVAISASSGGSDNVERLGNRAILNLQPHGEPDGGRMSEVIPVVVIVINEGRVAAPADEFELHNAKALELRAVRCVDD